MDRPAVVAERDVELPRTIVWDAFIDPVLVEGWLGALLIDPDVGGEYNLTWLDRLERPAAFGRIAAIRYPELLIVDTDSIGRLEVTLTELTGGLRGTAARVRVEVGIDGDALAIERMTGEWTARLERLEQLLRGYPTDWSRVAPA